MFSQIPSNHDLAAGANRRPGFAKPRLCPIYIVYCRWSGKTLWYEFLFDSSWAKSIGTATLHGLTAAVAVHRTASNVTEWLRREGEDDETRRALQAANPQGRLGLPRPGVAVFPEHLPCVFNSDAGPQS